MIERRTSIDVSVVSGPVTVQSSFWGFVVA
jgi:hypothetical protein